MCLYLRFVMLRGLHGRNGIYCLNKNGIKSNTEYVEGNSAFHRMNGWWH